MNPVPPTPPLPLAGTIDLVPLLAHQGGWDEALLVGMPLAIIGLLLWVANRRVSAQLAAAEDQTTSATIGEPDTDDQS